MNRYLFFRYAFALAMLFSIGCLFFFALPTMPPWMISSPSWNPSLHVERIAFDALGLVQAKISGNSEATLSTLDANPLAAMPSIHTGVTMLFFLASRQYRRRWQVASLCYVMLMGMALVYLGEHSVLDVFAGILAAIAAWRMSIAIHSWWHSWAPAHFLPKVDLVQRARALRSDLHGQ
jgi:membrane-associated phospholipid phosphatase